MKVKALIDALSQFADDEEVSVGNCDIHFVDIEPSYYDGCQQVLIRDEARNDYNIIGATRRESGTKVVIHTLSIREAIWDDPDLPIDYSQLSGGRQADYQAKDDEQRVKCRECIARIEAKKEKT